MAFLWSSQHRDSISRDYKLHCFTRSTSMSFADSGTDDRHLGYMNIHFPLTHESRGQEDCSMSPLLNLSAPELSGLSTQNHSYFRQLMQQHPSRSKRMLYFIPCFNMRHPYVSLYRDSFSVGVSVQVLMGYRYDRFPSIRIIPHGNYPCK